MTLFLSDWFNDALVNVRCSQEVKAYIIDVFTHHGGVQVDGSITLKFIEVRETGQFAEHQKLGDWALWSASNAPNTHREVIIHVGKSCYTTCNRLLKNAWPLYAELAHDFPKITEDIIKSLSDVRGQGLIHGPLKVPFNNEK